MEIGVLAMIEIAPGAKNAAGRKCFWRRKSRSDELPCNFAASRATMRATLQRAKKPIESSFRADVQM